MRASAKRVMITMMVMMLAPLIAWLGGYNFDHRGEAAVLVVIFMIFLGVATYTCPFIEDN